MDSTVVAFGQDYQSYIDRFMNLCDEYEKNKHLGYKVEEIEKATKSIVQDMKKKYGSVSLLNKLESDTNKALTNPKFAFLSMVSPSCTNPEDQKFLNAFHYYRTQKLEAMVDMMQKEIAELKEAKTTINKSNEELNTKNKELRQMIHLMASVL